MAVQLHLHPNWALRSSDTRTCLDFILLVKSMWLFLASKRDLVENTEKRENEDGLGGVCSGWNLLLDILDDIPFEGLLVDRVSGLFCRRSSYFLRVLCLLNVYNTHTTME